MCRLWQEAPGDGREAHHKASWIIEKSDVHWEEARHGIGSKGTIVVKDRPLRVWEARDGLPGNQNRLYAGKMDNGGIRQANGDAPEGTQLEKFWKLSPRRWSIGQCHG
jgi:hypothetical protein